MPISTLSIHASAVCVCVLCFVFVRSHYTVMTDIYEGKKNLTPSTLASSFAHYLFTLFNTEQKQKITCIRVEHIMYVCHLATSSFPFFYRMHGTHAHTRRDHINQNCRFKFLICVCTRALLRECVKNFIKYSIEYKRQMADDRYILCSIGDGFQTAILRKMPHVAKWMSKRNF